MTRNDFFSVCKNAEKIDMYTCCKNADFEINGKAYKVSEAIFDSDELNDILNEVDTRFVIVGDPAFEAFVPVINWETKLEVIEVTD